VIVQPLVMSLETLSKGTKVPNATSPRPSIEHHKLEIVPGDEWDVNGGVKDMLKPGAWSPFALTHGQPAIGTSTRWCPVSCSAGASHPLPMAY
jgi:hypothetical protein